MLPRKGKDAFIVGDYVHVYNRGTKKMAIVRDANDRWRFLQMLYYFNTEQTPPNPFLGLAEELGDDFNKRLVWPESWGTQRHVVSILAFSLMENHFHLLLKEIREGGIAFFMQRLGTGITMRFNTKYKESGRLFQGPYKARRIDKDSNLEYVSVYVQVKNPFELFPEQLRSRPQLLREKDAVESVGNNTDGFEKAYRWAAEYSYCSLGDYAEGRKSPIIDKDLLGKLYPTPQSYKKLARECLVRMDLEKELKPLNLEGN